MNKTSNAKPVRVNATKGKVSAHAMVVQLGRSGLDITKGALYLRMTATEQAAVRAELGI